MSPPFQTLHAELPLVPATRRLYAHFGLVFSIRGDPTSMMRLSQVPSVGLFPHINEPDAKQEVGVSVRQRKSTTQHVESGDASDCRQRSDFYYYGRRVCFRDH